MWRWWIGENVRQRFWSHSRRSKHSSISSINGRARLENAGISICKLSNAYSTKRWKNPDVLKTRIFFSKNYILGAWGWGLALKNVTILYRTWKKTAENSKSNLPLKKFPPVSATNEPYIFKGFTRQDNSMDKT